MKAWTTKEIQYLIKNALLAETNEVLNLQEIAKKLNRTVQSVRNKVYNLQRDGDLPKVQRELAIDSYKRPWTEKEDKRLLAMRSQGQTYLEIANELEQTVASVSNRAARLIKNNKAKPLSASWTANQISVLIDNVKFDENGFVHNYEEGTYHPGYDKFICTDCYVKAGQPLMADVYELYVRQEGEC